MPLHTTRMSQQSNTSKDNSLDMKRAFTIVLSIITCSLFVSCEQPAMLSVSQTALSFENKGGNQSVTLTANKVWTASSNQGWLRVSPSSGEGNATLSVSCEGNTTYDTRTGTITIVSEELTQTISVSQAEGLGLLISQPEYNLSNEAQTIDVTVQANVQYTVDIDNACRDWIKQESTKGLSSNTIKFAISKNESYDGREGKITIRQANGNLSATVIVKQSQTNGLFADKTEYEVSYEEQQLNIKVKSNVDYDVQIDDSCKDWISRVQTKGLVESTVTLAIEKNEGEDRTGSFVIKFGSLEERITVNQRTEGYVEFEDSEFEAYCVEHFDNNNDGEISYAEAKLVKVIEVNTYSIFSVKGIEYMPNLTQLLCAGETFVYRKGKLTNLDVSHNAELKYLYCQNNQLTSLDVSHNTALVELYCNHNEITSLDVSRNTNLEVLYCYNNRITSLDVSRNTNLEVLYCYINALTSLDVSHNTALVELDCSSNGITSLDMSNNTAVQKLYCTNTRISSLDVSHNTALKELSCGSNGLVSLDVSHNTALEYLFCHNNPLTSLDVSKNTALKVLNCYSSHLRSLDVSKNTALTSLQCSGNQMKSLDVSKNTALEALYCSDNQLLTSLDVSKNTALTILQCVYSQLTSLDVSKNTALETIHCYNNHITSLDVSQNTALKELRCQHNQLTGLDVSKNPMLAVLWCSNNPNLSEIWLKTGQTIAECLYDTDVATIKYK